MSVLGSSCIFFYKAGPESRVFLPPGPGLVFLKSLDLNQVFFPLLLLSRSPSLTTLSFCLSLSLIFFSLFQGYVLLQNTMEVGEFCSEKIKKRLQGGKGKKEKIASKTA